MTKSADAFRTISEVAEWLDTPAHVLRFWESKFTQVKPVKRAGGRRYYRPADMRLLGGIKKLLHEDGMTIKGAQKILREQGVKHVASLCPLTLGEEDDTADIMLEDVPASEPIDTVVPFNKAPEAADETPQFAFDTENQGEPDATDEAEPPVETADIEETAQDTAPPVEQIATDETEHDAASSADTNVEDTAAVADTVHQDVGPNADNIEAAAEVATDDADAAAASLPGFLQRSMEERIEETVGSDVAGSADAPANDVEPTHDDTDKVETDSQPVPFEPTPYPTVLSALSKVSYLPPDTAKEIAPLVERLRKIAG